MRPAFLVAALLAPIALASSGARAAEPESTAGCRPENRIFAQLASQFQDAWARGDKDAVLALTDPAIVTQGTDLAEITHGRDELVEQMERELAVAEGHASFGDTFELAVDGGCDSVGVVFLRRLHMPSGLSPMTRAAMTWRAVDGPGGTTDWRLVLYTLAIPTVGQSAAKMLGKK